MATKKASPIQPSNLSKELSPGWLLAELLGTFILVMVALNGSINPILITLAVLAISLALGRLSGAHVNPAITVSQFVIRRISAVKAAGYIVMQLVGAMLAVVVATKFIKGGNATVFSLFDPSTGHLPGAWKPIFGELVGAAFFGFGFTSAVMGVKEGLEKAFTVAGSLLIGIIIAVSGSYGVINPAIAMAISAFPKNDMWSLSAYAIAPIVGASLGALLYKYMQTDVERTAKS